MFGIRIENGIYDISIAIDKVKYVIGSNYAIKYFLINAFNSLYAKIKSSEYAIDNHNIVNIFYNDEKYNFSDIDYYFVSENYDAFNDLKLGTRSLFLKYIAACLEKIEYTPEYQTLTLIYEDVTNLILNNLNDIFDEDIRFAVESELSKKQLIKELTFNYLKEDLIINNLDLSFEENIVIQLKMIRKIASIQNKRSIVIINIPIMTEKIRNEIIKSTNNCSYIVLTNKICFKVQYYEIMIVDNIILDLCDDNAVYEVGQKYGLTNVIECREKILELYKINC